MSGGIVLYNTASECSNMDKMSQCFTEVTLIMFHGPIGTCACSRYQAFSFPGGRLGRRLVLTKPATFTHATTIF